MKSENKAGTLCKIKIGKLFLMAVIIAATCAALCSCTTDELLEIADSVAREYYASQLGVSVTPTTAVTSDSTAVPTTAPTTEATTSATVATTAPTTVPTTAPTTAATTVPTTASTEATTPASPVVTFEMPFADKAHGGTNYNINQYFSSSHGGMDFGVYWGNEILASTSGKVVYAYNNGDISQTSGDLRWTYGTFVVIETFDGKYRTYYAHMSKKAVNVGDIVTQGQVVGYAGNTGRVISSSTGPYAGTHLHFEVRALEGNSYVKKDPRDFLPWWN